jgi:hypothetical protein
MEFLSIIYFSILNCLPVISIYSSDEKARDKTYYRIQKTIRRGIFHTSMLYDQSLKEGVGFSTVLCPIPSSWMVPYGVCLIHLSPSTRSLVDAP